MTELLDTPTMRQLDTGALVTLKQRIERELMRRGDVEQVGANAAAVAVVDAMAELAGFTGATSDDLTQAIEVDKQAEAAAMNTPAPLAKRKLLREPDPGCTRCWGRGTQVSYSNATVALTKLCPCLWGGE